MQHELEIEFKNLLTQSEFAQLTAAFHATEFIRQTNTYFDTTDAHIKARGGALRIREKGDAVECTLKLPNPDGHGLNEFTQQLRFEAEKQALTYLEEANEIHTLLGEFAITDPLHQLTSLTTKRCEFPYEQGLLVLDESFYSGHHDFEIEFEHFDYELGLEIFTQLLTTHQIPTRQTPSKIKRAMAVIG